MSFKADVLEASTSSLSNLLLSSAVSHAVDSTESVLQAFRMPGDLHGSCSAPTDSARISQTYSSLIITYLPSPATHSLAG